MLKVSNAALERLAHSSHQRSPLRASPLQALVRPGGSEHGPPVQVPRYDLLGDLNLPPLFWRWRYWLGLFGKYVCRVGWCRCAR